MKRNNRINGVLLLLFVGAILMGGGAIQKVREDTLYNTTRLLVADAMQSIEKGEVPSSSYPYAIIDFGGNVTYADPAFGFGKVVNLKEVLQFDKSFFGANKEQVKTTFVMERDNRVVGFVLFLIPTKEAYDVSDKELTWIILGPLIGVGVLVGIWMMIQSIYLKKRIVEPMDEICYSAQGIIEGNYDLEVAKTTGKVVKDDEVGELTYAFELMRDELKNRIHKEKQLKKSQKELIACISHDLKTPISSIKAYSEGLRDGVIQDKEKLQRYANVIVQKSDVLSQMIDDLLEHSKAELNELTIEKKEVYFKDYFESLMQELGLVVHKHHMTLKVYHDAPNFLVEMDERRITQVLYNLVENSIKYASQGKAIEITAALQGNRLAMTVKDYGPGIQMGDIPYVFDKFYRAEKSRGMSVPGSGLGLSICKYIIEAHGGTLTCTSKVQEGTSFTFTLPRDVNRMG